MLRVLSLLAATTVAVLQLSACESTYDESEANAAPGRGARKVIAPREIRWLRSSAEYRASALQAYAGAAARIEVLARGRAPLSWAVSLDADETVLNNSPYQKDRAAQGLGFSPESFTAWVRKQAAEAIPGAAAFTARVRALGGRVVIVTNRIQDECADTEVNLRKVNVTFDLVLCMSETFEKEPRWKTVEEGTASRELPALPLLMYVGDNITDFPELTQDVRFKSDAAFAPFGDRFVVIPNPMYGSWDKNPDPADVTPRVQ